MAQKSASILPFSTLVTQLTGQQCPPHNNHFGIEMGFRFSNQAPPHMRKGQIASKLNQVSDHDYNLKMEIAIADATMTTFERLRCLLEKGYEPDLRIKRRDAFVLRHPKAALPQRVAVLYSNGLFVSGMLRIGRTEQAEFAKFLSTTPKATWRDTSRTARRILWNVGIVVFFVVIVAVVMSQTSISN